MKLLIILLILNGCFLNNICYGNEENNNDKKYKVRYFGTRGRAELIRLVLEECGLYNDYSTINYGKNWIQEKSDGIKNKIMPFGQLPILSIDNKRHIPQSTAIVYYLSKQYGLYPFDIEQALNVDIVYGLSVDIRNRVSRLVYSPDFDDKRNDVVEDLRVWIKYSSELLNNNEYFANNKFSLGDLAMFDVLNMLLALQNDILDKYANIKAWHKKIAERPAILNYVKSDRRPKYQNGKSAYFDNEKNPSNFKLHTEL